MAKPSDRELGLDLAKSPWIYTNSKCVTFLRGLGVPEKRDSDDSDDRNKDCPETFDTGFDRNFRHQEMVYLKFHGYI